MNPIILHDYPEADYHSQTGEETPLFSYSVAKTINSKSAYHAWLQHPLLGNEPRKPTATMDKGSIIHGLLLGGGQEIVIIQADSFRTNAAKDERDLAYSEDKIPILEMDMEKILVGTKIIKTKIHELAPYFFDDHQSELSVKWTMDNGVKCQSRFDWIQPEKGLIIDLKTTNDANPKVLDNHCNKFGYQIQLDMYTKAAEKTWPDMAGRFKWIFLFVEPEPPYMISINYVDGSMYWLGNSELQRAADKWKTCINSDDYKNKSNWPGYGENTISAPGWAVSREEGE